MNKAIFFDRDGVLNELVKRDGGYYSPREISKFKIVPNSIEVTNFTKSKGYLNILISNQPDIARGFLSLSCLNTITESLQAELDLDDVFYCIHDSNMCDCRKPLPGLIYQAQSKWDIDLTKSVMIGDTWKDGEAAMTAGVKFLLLDRDYNKDYDCPNRINSIEDILKLI